MIREERILTASIDGFSTTCDAFVIRSESEDEHFKELLFLSVVGSQSVVKAISAGVVKRKAEPVSFSTLRQRLAVAIKKPESGTWRLRTMRLPESRAWHSIVYSTMFEFDRDDSDFLLLAEPDTPDVSLRHLQFLNRRIALPIYPDWKDWLWQRSLMTGESKSLTAEGVQAWQCNVDEGALRRDIERGIQAGELMVPRKEDYARLESQAKAGYYPTPDSVIEQVAHSLQRGRHPNRKLPVEEQVIRVLDPCCGTGDAVARVGQTLVSGHLCPVEFYGIEVSSDRAAEARVILDDVLNADFFNCSLAHNAFSLLYLNPPYDNEGYTGQGPKRTEMAFLERATRYLMPEVGVLVFVIPKRILWNSAIPRFLASYYKSVRCWDFPEDERDVFGQVVVMGVRREKPTVLGVAYTASRIEGWATNPPEYKRPQRVDEFYKCCPATAGAVLFNTIFHDPVAISAEAAAKGLWHHPAMRQALWPESDVLKRPLMPLRQGHVAQLTAAGFLDNLLLERDDQRILVKGRTYKEYETVEETEAKIVRRERMRTTVVRLDVDTGIFTDIQA